MSEIQSEDNVPSESRASSGPSASSTSVVGNNYFVFLSFRGPDTRKGFADHLFQRLHEVGLRFHPDFVFRDDEKLRFGKKIADSLLSAIQRSKISVPIISKNYATSAWCLRELIQIMECVEKGEQTVYPVLYKVKTSDVREMKGKFGDNFRRHEHELDEEVKQKGMEALKKALDLRVFESEKFASGYEGQLVKQLAQEILREHQRHIQPQLPGNLVGTDDIVWKLTKLVNIDHRDTKIIGIWGKGGIGKTTLATIIYKKLFDCFEKRSFRRDIRETIKRKGIEHVQSLLISDISGNFAITVRESRYGIQSIRSSCEDQKVLILLDDVDCQDNLDNLIGGCNFGLGSRIIITCRDQSLLKTEYKKVELKEMNWDDSLLLFTKHAFVKEQPTIKFWKLSREIVRITGGIPLALMIVGSHLNGKPENIWIETLEKLKKTPHKEVQKVSRISYDSLEYEEQQIFLDIACFFIGIHKKFAIYMWEDLWCCRDSTLNRLIDLSLVEVDKDDKLRMHDHLQDLGRAIARPLDKKLWNCSRLWGEEAITVQRSKDENRNIEALHLDEKGSERFIKRESFKRMPYLKFLHLSEERFAGDFEDSLSELRWLEWEKCPDSFEEIEVHLEKLLILDLSYGLVSASWGGWRSIKMETLKALNLSGCSNLENTPDLSALKNLEMLILEDCQRLEQIDPSIGHIKSLVSLDLRECIHLKKLPSEVGELKGLVSLNLRGCTSLNELPSEIGELKRLVSLDLWNCRGLKELPGEVDKLEELKELIIGRTVIKEIPFIGSLKKLEMLNACGGELVELPDWISCLVNLSTLDLRFCLSLRRRLPESIGSLVKLKHLLLCHDHAYQSRILAVITSRHHPLNHIPHSIGKLKSLIELSLSGAKISELPDSIGDLSSLKIFNIDRCRELESLPGTICRLGKLEELDASFSYKLKGGVFKDGLFSLKILQLRATRISTLRNSIGELSSLEELDLQDCKEIVWLPELPANLRVLKVTCQDHTLPQFSRLVHLKELTVKSCKFLERMPKLPSGLLELSVSSCDNLKELPSLSNLELLLHLYIERCRELTGIMDLEGLKSLDSLYLSTCEKLTEIKGLEGLKSLRSLHLYGCKKLSNLDGLEHLESLISLIIRELDAQVVDLDRLKNLEELMIFSCQSLKRLDISELTHLQALRVKYCQKLVEVEGFGRVQTLKLDMMDCPSIATSLDPSTFNKMSVRKLERCGRLSDDWERLKEIRTSA